MKLSMLAAALLAAINAAAPATAQQFQANSDILGPSGNNGASYVGPADNANGQVNDGGRDAFDGFGFYLDGTGNFSAMPLGLTQTRRVELLSGNVYRFFDTFTNLTGSAISGTLDFYGNPGSDGAELVSLDIPGLIVSCQNDGSGGCGSDPVLALVSGNNGLVDDAMTSNRYDARFAISNIGAGQSFSLLTFAFLASNVSGTNAADVTLAQETGRSLRSAPRLEGLTAVEQARIINFDVGAVPEPATWGLMLLGMGMVGAGMRSRRRTTVAYA